MVSVAEREKEFDAFFEGLGFERVSTIVGHSPDFKNADYIHRERRTIVELKILEKDFFREGGIIDRFCGLVPAPVDVNADGTGLYTIRWPEVNREGRTDTFEEALRRILKKANRQLRETIAATLNDDGIGLILLAACNFRSLHPDWLSRLVAELLSEEFSSVDGYVLCTPGWRAPSCIPNVPFQCPQLIATTCYWLAQEWCEFEYKGGHRIE